VHGRVSDIWRSYISQRLLWDVGYHIAFSPPMVDQLRSPHNYLADMQVRKHSVPLHAIDQAADTVLLAMRLCHLH
jgi:hypothetical protein